MKCPKCGATLVQREIGNVKVEACPKCGGTWFDAGEFRLLKDRESKGDFRWFDIDLWRHRDRFAVRRRRKRVCPKDGQTMTAVHYDDSQITVDTCPQCHGVWLDRNEYRRIIRYIEHRVDSESVGELARELPEEFLEIFTGPEGPISEAADFLKVLYLIELRFMVEHRGLASTLQTVARGIPGA